MNSCSLGKLAQLLNKELDLDTKLDVLNHLDLCKPCRETIYHLAHDRDRRFFVDSENAEGAEVA
jgi:hypothetical protein